MYIIGEREDYYDSVSKSGIDKSIIWKRTPVEKEYNSHSEQESRYLVRKKDSNPRYPFPRFMTRINSWWGNFDEYDGKFRSFINPVSGGIVGFCGKLYPFFQFKHYLGHEVEVDENALIMKTKDVYYYRTNEIEEHVLQYMNNKQAEHFLFGSATKYSVCPTIKDYEFWFRQIDAMEQDKNVQILFDNFNIPVFFARRTERTAFITSHFDKLNTLQFYKVINPYQAFQQIQMFLGNAVTTKPMPVISDELKAESKGFDKFSFRNTPRSKPNRKRKK